jgi:hypothetical protein
MNLENRNSSRLTNFIKFNNKNDDVVIVIDEC